MIVGKVMSSDNSYEFLDLHTNTILVKAKFTPIKVTADREKYLEKVKMLDHELVLEWNAGKHEKVRPKVIAINELDEMENARKVVTEDKDPSLMKNYSKNKTWIIADVYFHHMKAGEKTIRVKWKGYQLIEDSCDLSEAKLLASGYPIEDLAVYPPKQQYAKKKRIDIKHLFNTHAAINDLYINKEIGKVKFQSGLGMDWLGIHISRDRIKKSIILSQNNYIERMISYHSKLIQYS